MKKDFSNWVRQAARCTGIVLLLGSGAQAEEESPASGIFETVECVGNLSTDCSIIGEEIYRSPGDLIDQRELENSRTRLLLRGLFQEVRLSLEKTAVPGHVRVRAEVTELSPSFSYLGAGYSFGNDGGADTINFTAGTRNLLGLGKYLSVRVSADGDSGPDGSYRDQAVSFLYLDPHFLGSQRFYYSLNLGTLNASINKNTIWWLPGNPAASGHVAETWGGASFGAHVFDFGYVQVGDQLASHRYSDITGEVSNIGDFDSNDFYVGAGWNSLNDIYFPTRGSAFGIELDSVHSPNYEYASATLNYESMWDVGHQFYLEPFLNRSPEGFPAVFMPGVALNYDLVHNGGGEIRNSRLYLSLGGGNLVAVGWKFESKTLGVVNLSLGLQIPGTFPR